MIRVLTLNLAGLNFQWFEKRRDTLISAVRTLSPDVFFLQEATLVPDSHYDQTEDIGKNTGLNNRAFASYGNSQEFQSPKIGGVSILSKWPFHSVRNVKLPPGTLDKYGARVALIARINVSGKELELVVTHLSWRREEASLRVEQGREILKAISFEVPVVIAGDFNATSEEEVIKNMQKKVNDVSADREGDTWDRSNEYITFSHRSSGKIDYIFCSENLRFRNTKVVLNQRCPVFPSDHFGVITEVIW